MAGKRPGGMPSIMLVDIPAHPQSPVRIRIYLDRHCIHDSEVIADSLDRIAARTIDVWKEARPDYVIVDAPHPLGRGLHEMLRHHGVGFMGKLS